MVIDIHRFFIKWNNYHNPRKVIWKFSKDSKKAVLCVVMKKGEGYRSFPVEYKEGRKSYKWPPNSWKCMISIPGLYRWTLSSCKTGFRNFSDCFPSFMILFWIAVYCQKIPFFTDLIRFCLKWQKEHYLFFQNN